MNLSSLKNQAEGTNREYDRLLQEHEKLQVSIMFYLKMLSLVSLKN